MHDEGAAFGSFGYVHARQIYSSLSFLSILSSHLPKSQNKSLHAHIPKRPKSKLAPEIPQSCFAKSSRGRRPW